MRKLDEVKIVVSRQLVVPSCEYVRLAAPPKQVSDGRNDRIYYDWYLGLDEGLADTWNAGDGNRAFVSAAPRGDE